MPAVPLPGVDGHADLHPRVLRRVRVVADRDLVLILGRPVLVLGRARRAARERRGAEDAERHEERRRHGGGAERSAVLALKEISHHAASKRRCLSS